MRIGKFNTSITDSIDLLKKFNLYKSTGPKGTGVYSQEFMKLSKGNDVVTIYECAIKNKDYDILLKDDSIIQFQKKDTDLRYAYIQNPYHFVSKQDYLTSIFTLDDLELYSDQLTNIDELIDEEEYEQFLNEQKLNSISNYFRYDCSPAGYDPLIHSYSHFHIGMNSNVRIPTSKIITPLKFTIFCVRNTYFEDWKKQFKSNPNFKDDILRIKKECGDLDKTMWSNHESNDLYLI